MILIVGRGGQLGTSFANLLGPGGRSLGLDELDLDAGALGFAARVIDHGLRELDADRLVSSLGQCDALVSGAVQVRTLHHRNLILEHGEFAAASQDRSVDGVMSPCRCLNWSSFCGFLQTCG